MIRSGKYLAEERGAFDPRGAEAHVGISAQTEEGLGAALGGNDWSSLLADAHAERVRILLMGELDDALTGTYK